MKDLIEIGPVNEGDQNTMRLHAPVGLELANMAVYAYLTNRQGESIAVGNATAPADFDSSLDDLDITVDWDTTGLAGGSAFGVDVVANPGLGSQKAVSVDEYMVTIKQGRSYELPAP